MRLPFGATMRMPRDAPRGVALRSMAKRCMREAFGFATSSRETRCAAASRSLSSRSMPPRSRATSAERWTSARAGKASEMPRARKSPPSSTTAARKTKSAAMRRIAARVNGGEMGSDPCCMRSFVAALLRMTPPPVASLSCRSNRGDRPAAVLLLAQGDVELAILHAAGGADGPVGDDVVLPLGADLARALRVEAARLGLAEKRVEDVRGLVAAEEAALIDETGELQHHLVAVGHAGHDGLRVAAAEAAREVRHGHVEVLELRGCDDRQEGERHCDCDVLESHDLSPGRPPQQGAIGGYSSKFNHLAALENG